MIKEILLNESEKWDKIVKSFKNYDAFYLSSYVKAFKHQGAGEPILFYYENGKNRAINVCFKRDISLSDCFKDKIPADKYFDLCSPYGYGGFWSDTNIPNEAITEYEEYCKSNGYVCEFVRFELFSNYKDLFNGEIETKTHNVIRNLDIPLDEMMMDFEHKVRKNLKKANENGLKIIIEQNDSHLDDFLRIYYSTMDRNDASNSFYFDKEFYEIINEMQENIAYFHVAYEDKIISTELIIFGAENAYSYLGGTDRDYFNFRPNDFLKFEIIKWCKEKGLKNFVLGGGYGEDDGIFNYKKSFAPNGVADFYIGRKIFDQNKYNELVNIRKQEEDFEENSKFFPVYRS